MHPLVVDADDVVPDLQAALIARVAAPHVLHDGLRVVLTLRDNDADAAVRVLGLCTSVQIATSHIGTTP